jgi:AbrB family looped-hinge helix DNA binding protein
MTTMTVQIRRKGVITLPIELRRQYGLGEGDIFTLIDLGDGSILLTSQVSQVAQRGNQVARLMEDEDVTLEDMIEALDEEREAYYKEHYVEA